MSKTDDDDPTQGWIEAFIYHGSQRGTGGVLFVRNSDRTCQYILRQELDTSFPRAFCVRLNDIMDDDVDNEYMFFVVERDSSMLDVVHYSRLEAVRAIASSEKLDT